MDNQLVENAIPNQSVFAVAPWRPAHGHTCDVASPTKNPIMKVTADVMNAQTTEETCRSDMVAGDTVEVHAAHATSTPAVGKYNPLY